MYFFECLTSKENSKKYVLVVFCGQDEGSDRELAYCIESNFEKINCRPEEIVFIFPEYLEGKYTPYFLDGTKFYENITRFGQDIPVTMLSFSVVGKLTISKRILGNSKVVFHAEKLRQSIIEVGLKNLVKNRKSEVLLEAPSGTVFIKPSHKEYDIFVKTGALAVSCSEVQFVAYCLMCSAPASREVKKIFIDTNSIAVYIEALLFYWTRFHKSECKTATYESFGSYSGVDEFRPDYVDDVWVIISASKSNNLAIEIAQKWGLYNEQVLTMLSFSDAQAENVGDEIITNISSLTNSKLESQEGAEYKLKMQGESFTAEIDGPVPVVIGVRDKPKSISEWVDQSVMSRVFQSNKLAKTNGSPKAVFIDSRKYIENNPSFCKWLDTIIKWYTPPLVKWIVYDDNNSGGRYFAELVRSKLNDINVDVDLVELNDVPKMVPKADNVIIALPVISEGKSLLRLNRNFRIAGHTGNRMFLLPFIVARKKSQLSDIKSSLAYGPRNWKYPLFNLNSITVGHAEERSSWIRELEMADNFSSGFWLKRAEVLRDLSAGLCGAIGVCLPSVNDKLNFSRDFAFWDREYDPKDVEPEAVYVTISAILQSLREHQDQSGKRSNLFNHLYQHSVISPDNFSRYNDGLLQSCLWRAANSRELDYRSSIMLSKDFTDTLIELLIDQEDNQLNGGFDLFVGVGIGKIKVNGDDLRRLVGFVASGGFETQVIEVNDYIRRRYLNEKLDDEIDIVI